MASSARGEHGHAKEEAQEATNVGKEVAARVHVGVADSLHILAELQIILSPFPT